MPLPSWQPQETWAMPKSTSNRKQLSTLQWINLALRGIMETGIVLGFGYWGYHAGTSKTFKLLLAIFSPLVGFGFWSLVDFHQLGQIAEPLRLLQELFISGLAAIAFYTAGAHIFGYILALFSIVHHILVYFLGETLLKKVS